MSLRLSCAVLSILLIAACGFQPLYGKKNYVRALDGGVKISAPKGLLGQQLKSELEDNLNPNSVVPEKPAYKLDTTIAINSNAIGQARDGTVSRYNVYIDSTYKLTRTVDNLELTHGTLRQVSSYNNPVGQYFSTFVSQADANRRGISELAEMYRQRISEYLDNAPENLKIYTPAPAPTAPDSMSKYMNNFPGAQNNSYSSPGQQNNNPFNSPIAP